MDSTEPSPTPPIPTTPSAPIRQLPPAPTTMTNTPEGVAQYFISSLESCALRNAFTDTFDEPAMTITFYQPYIRNYVELREAYERGQWGYGPNAESNLLQAIQDEKDTIIRDYQDIAAITLKVRNQEKLEFYETDSYMETKQRSYEQFENQIDNMESICYAQGDALWNYSLGQVTISGNNKAKIKISNKNNVEALLSLQKQSDGQWRIIDFTNLSIIKRVMDSIKE